MATKIKDVLPKKHVKMLTPAARELTQKQLSKIMSSPGSDHHNLKQKDINSITNLAIERINKGQSMFGFKKMNIKTTKVNNDDDGPNRNW